MISLNVVIVTRAILLVMFVVVVWISGVMILLELEGKEYCISHGYEGVRSSDGLRCYNDVPHPSGVGYEREYSGIIDLRGDNKQ